MPAIKYDVSGVKAEDNAPRVYETPKPGVYTCKVLELNHGFTQGDKDRPRLEAVLEIIKPKYKGSRLWEYLTFNEASLWKLDQFLQAFGISQKKRKGSFKTEDIVGLPVKVQIINRTDDSGELRARVRAFISAEDEELDDMGDDDDGDMDVDTDEELEDDEEEAEDEEESEDEEEAPEEEDLETLGINADDEDEPSMALLTEKAEAAGIDPDEYETWAEVATAIAEADGSDEGDDAPADNYDSLSTTDLRAAAKERELDAAAIRKAKTKAQLIALLREDDGDEPF